MHRAANSGERCKEKQRTAELAGPSGNHIQPNPLCEARSSLPKASWTYICLTQSCCRGLNCNPEASTWLPGAAPRGFRLPSCSRVGKYSTGLPLLLGDPMGRGARVAWCTVGGQEVKSGSGHLGMWYSWRGAWREQWGGESGCMGQHRWNAFPGACDPC